MSPRLAAFAALLLLLPGIVHADALLRFVDSEGQHSEILVKGPYARMDIANGGGSAGFMLFNANDRSLYIVDQTSRTYMPFDERAIDAQVQAMEQMISEMRAQIQQLPREARAELEAQLGLSVGGGPVDVQTRSTGRTQQIGGLRCEENEIRGRRTGAERRLCHELGRSRTVAAGLPDRERADGTLFDLSRRALDAGGPMARAMSSNVLPQLDGVPLEVRHVRDDLVTRLAGVSTDTLSPEFFRIPQNYREQDPF
jgi:hypothetical protein